MNTILIVGNVVDGLSFIGPFMDSEEAGDHAERHFKGEDWTACNLDQPVTPLGE